MREKRSDRNRMLQAAAVLFCLVLLSVWLLSGIFARFTSGDTGQDDAHIAAVALNVQTLVLDDMLADMQPGTERQVTFTVTNGNGGAASESAQVYSIAVQTSGNLPLTMRLEPTTSGTEAASGLTGGGSKWQTTSDGRLPANRTVAHTYLLTVTWPAGQTAAGLSQEIDSLRIIVDAR